jgi:hypothetical protein
MTLQQVRKKWIGYLTTAIEAIQQGASKLQENIAPIWEAGQPLLRLPLLSIS